ncbi:MAG TPA: hypothetical protein VEX87_25130 [Skermanella sp.]|jgi:hypothetical protein|nr:hypothetical protein [Skermanella sp.]
MSGGVLQGKALSSRTRHHLLNNYATSLIYACSTVKLGFPHASYSERELRLALDEADVDLAAMFSRRRPVNGISAGKIAGIIAFRLSRFKIVHIDEDGQNQPLIYLIQDLAAIFAVQFLLLRTKIPELQVLEIAYQLSRRHANQETLGLVFDTIINKPV